ncbi:hypothetical protein SK128_025912 [Halocaridina rubra]|uniref:Mutator-like transposase domain-containing protein n=1 Tax=Halocaridina rubra TaxID=373956 RepID=A0AAN9FTQ1_HALRR
MKVKEAKVDGMTNSFIAVCGDCKVDHKMCKLSGGMDTRYDVHNRFVKSTLSSGGYAGAKDLFIGLNMHPLSDTSYYKIAKEIEEEGNEKFERMMEKTVVHLHEILKKRGGNDQDVKDIKVLYDGSWSKHRFSAMYGFVSVTEATTGLCVDFEVLIVSDGDSKGYSVIRELDPYDGLSIEKTECVNHVSMCLDQLCSMPQKL